MVYLGTAGHGFCVLPLWGTSLSVQDKENKAREGNEAESLFYVAIFLGTPGTFGGHLYKVLQ